MDDTTLWAVALGVGVLGLVLVVVAGAAAISANARARRSRQAPPALESHPQTESLSADRSGGGGGWVWMKAGVFAFIHAGAVSFVLGGLTFFEDIAKANEEIRTTGTVTFPKRLLPKTLSGPDARLSFSRSSDELLANNVGHANPGVAERVTPEQPTPPHAEGADWEVVDALLEDETPKGVLPEDALE